MQNKYAAPIRVIAFTVGVVFFYIFLEWIFIITKPSYMNVLGFLKKAEVGLVSASFFSLLLLLVLVVLMCSTLLLNVCSPFKKKISFLYVGNIVPSFLLTSLSLLLFDNFTYTLFGFGIVHSYSLYRVFLAISFLLVFGYLFKKNLHLLIYGSHVFWRKLFFVSLAFVAIPLFYFLLRYDLKTTFDVQDVSTASKKPNIILIQGDGIEASHTSLYGYERETTPVLAEIAETSLVAENAYANCGNTTGSFTSLLTGKHPLKTRVVYPPDILRGNNAYEHLPGVLKSLGYHTVQVTHPHFIDARTVNMLNSFDITNGVNVSSNKMQTFLEKIIPNDFAYFIHEITDRILNRLFHIYFIEEMENPYALVFEPSERLNDKSRLSKILELIESKKEPFFLHAHFMGTHGSKFRPGVQKFSQGKDLNTQDPWDTDLYDDSILEFDTALGEIFSALKKHDLFENSILIIGSDHGQKYKNSRVPFIIRFPNGEYAGRLTTNAQNMDVAPTILDYLGVKKLEGMEGESLIQSVSQRYIFTTVVAYQEKHQDGLWAINLQKLKPPFFQFRKISTNYCNYWYELDLINLEFESGNINGHTAPCDEGSVPDEQEVLGVLTSYLNESSFDVSSLKNLLSSGDSE